MKRGRHNIRRIVQDQITLILSGQNTPTTIFNLTRKISQNLNKKVSWNTVQKYIQELVESGKIQAIQLPHSKDENKPGLIVYSLKK